MIKKLRYLCTLLLIAVASAAWGDEETFSYSNYQGQGTQSSGSEVTMSGTNVSITNTKFYCSTNYNNAQFYANGTTTITPLNGVTITQVVLTASDSNYNGYQSGGTITASTGSVSSSGITVTWTGSATSAFTLTNNKQIRWTSIVVTYTASGGPTLNPSDLVLTGSPIALTFDLYNNSNAQVINYTTSSTGAITVSESDFVETLVDATNKTITVTPKAVTSSAQTITVSQAADNTYTYGFTTFTVSVDDSTPFTGSYFIFNSDERLSELNITKPESGSGTDLEIDEDYTIGSVTMNITNGSTNTRVWNSNGNTDLRVYNGGTLTFTVPVGYAITKVTFEGSSVELTGVTGKVWTASSNPVNTVTFTNGSTASKITTIKVEYESNSSPMISADDVNLDFNATSGSIAYTLTNEVTGGTLSAATTSDWLTVGALSNGTIALSCLTNGDAAPRTATVILTYTYGNNQTITKEVMVTQAGNPNVFDNISDISEVGTAYGVKGTVVATNARGLVLGDGTGYVYYYKNAAVTQSVGDIISISGTTGTYGHIIQFTNTATVETATESNYNHTPATTDITEVPDYSEGYYLSTYLQFEGKLNKDNNSYFITLGESQIQISYPTSDQGNALTALNGKTVLVKGYFTGINSNSIFTIMLESVEEVAGTDPVINAEDVTLEYNATSGEIEYTIINPVTGASLNATSDAEWISHIAIASDKVTFKTTANEGDADRTATITLTYGSVTKDITVTQGHYTTPSTEGTITFGSSDGSTQINSTSVTGSDSMGNTWTVTTTFGGEESFTQHEDCSQVGASKKPASSITFTTTLLSEITITKFEAKFGGYNDTAGDIILKVGDTEVGSGSLNGTEDVTVSNTQVATGTVLKVTVTNIAKGVKCYSISYSTNTDPYIEATVGEVLAHNATSGTVSYEVGNPVDGGVVTAATSAKWISNFVVGESTVTFDVTENTTGEDREGTITLTYTYDADKTATTDVTVSQHAAPYTLTVSDLSDVNLIVFRGDESESIINTENGESSAQVYSGTNVKISIDVETGYVLESLIVDGTDVTSQIDQTTGMYVFTMPSHNVAITATAILPSGDDYELFTGDLVEGDYIIYYDGKAMKNTVSNNRLDYVAVTPKDDVITTDNTAIVWHIAKSGDYWFIFNAAEGKFAVATGTKNQATLSETFDDKALWTVSGTETYEFVNKANAAAEVNANLRNNGTYGFACYATATGGALTLYKKAVSTKKGDLNNDGHVDVADVTALVNALKKGEEPEAGNIDGQNGVNSEDVKALVEMILRESNQ